MTVRMPYFRQMSVAAFQRYGFSASSAAPLYSAGYVAAWCLTSLCLGLLLERYARGRAIR